MFTSRKFLPLLVVLLMLALPVTALAAPAAQNSIPTITLTPELISQVVAILFSLAFAYIPRVKDWYSAREATEQAGIMGLVIILIGLGAFAVSCAGIITLAGIVCDKTGAAAIVSNIVSALIANQATYLLLVKPQHEAAKRLAETQATPVAPPYLKLLILLLLPLGAGLLFTPAMPAAASSAPLCNIDGRSIAKTDTAAADYVLTVEFKDVPVLNILGAKYGVPPYKLAYDWRAYTLNWGARYYETHGVYPGAEVFQNVGVWATLVNEFAACENMEAPLLEDGRLKRNFLPYWHW